MMFTADPGERVSVGSRVANQRLAAMQNENGCLRDGVSPRSLAAAGGPPMVRGCRENGAAVISWGTIFYGAALSAISAALLVFAVRRERPYDTLAVAALSGALGPLLWNAILHRVEGHEFFVDAPISVMPASWQDTGSGVFTVAVAALLLGFGPEAESGRGTALLALLCGLGAFLVDVYLY